MNEIKQDVCISIKEKVLNPLGVRRIHLPTYADVVKMSNQFKKAPQFQQVDLPKALQLHNGKVRVILVGEDTYCKRQCAMYLATIAESMRKSEEGGDLEDERWTSIDYDEDEDESSEDALTIIPDILVDPKCSSDPPEVQPISIRDLVCTGAIVEGIDNHIMTEWGATAFLHGFDEVEETPHLFISIKSEQMTSDLWKELQLNYGFVVCHVGTPTAEYLEEVFWTQAEKHYKNMRKNPNVDGKAVVKYLQHLQGKKFSQRDVESCVNRTISLEESSETITTEHFSFSPTALSESTSGRADLDAMVELNDVKKVVERLLAMDKLNLLRSEKDLKTEPRHRHMAFGGAPGTGKTVTAQIIAKILHEEGVGSGIFIEAGKEDLVGRFVGHTAPKVAKLFKKAQGGVLFLDEIGALVPQSSGGSDNYTEEAINALVYHMDRNPETVVIFATYPDEMDDFLNANPGLSSRVAQRLEFPSYSKESLLHILRKICEKQGYTIDKKAEKACGVYLQKEKELSPRTFGNGREVRRIFNAAEEEMAVRLAADETSHFGLTEKDMKTAISRLETKNKQTKRIIGFAG